jgi:hypothetical protein
MKDDHDDDHEDLGDQPADGRRKTARTLNLPTSCHILSMALSVVWRVPRHVGVEDKKIHQKRREGALFSPRI